MTERPKRRWMLALAFGCAGLAFGCVACAVLGVFLIDEEESETWPAPSGPVIAPDARSAMLGTYSGTYVASGRVAGFGQEYRDRGTISVTEGQGSDLVFTGQTIQTGDVCRIVMAWDGSVARVRPGQSCEGEFNDGTTYEGTLASGIARVDGDALSIDVEGRVWGARGFIPYAGNYTGAWRCTRVR